MPCGTQAFQGISGGVYLGKVWLDLTETSNKNAYEPGTLFRAQLVVFVADLLRQYGVKLSYYDVGVEVDQFLNKHGVLLSSH